MKRIRVTYLFLILSTIVLGLSSRKFPNIFHPFLVEYLGDTLWTLLVFWLFRLLLYKKSSITIGLITLGFSFLIEISQLYQAPWINVIRASTIGALVLGYGFLWTDLLCYTAGSMVGVAIDSLLMRKKHKF